LILINQEKPGPPLVRPLELGFCNVEADLQYIDGTLVVGHDCIPTWRCNDTLEEAYLQVLAARYVEYGEIYPGSKKLNTCTRFVMMVDVKTQADTTYEAIHTLLDKYDQLYPGFLTVYSYDQVVSKGAIEFLLSGNRVSPATLFAQEKRYAVLDGRINDNLDDDYGPEIMPWLSQSWGDVFDWRLTPFPEQVVIKLQNITEIAHSRQQKVRFWAAPQTDSFWEELIKYDVDLLNTDFYENLATYLRN